MKKILMTVAACIVAVNLTWAERVSEEDAALVASNFMNVATATPGALKAPAKGMVLKASGNASENNFYIYENANGEGWVMIAADDAVRPILAYSETGSFNTDDMPSNLRHWLRGYNKQIAHAAQNTAATEEVKSEWRRLRSGAHRLTATPVVAPLIQTTWDQDNPYWNLCPKKGGKNTYVGCVATSMAQVMKYWEWPKQGVGSHSVYVGTTKYTVDFGATTYDWENMTNSYSGSSTSAQKTAVATLMYHCGVAVDMQYGTYSEGGSGAYTIDWNGMYSKHGYMCSETALPEFFGYDASTIKGYARDGSASDGMRSWTKDEWITMLKEELDAERPIMYDGIGCDDPEDYETCYGHSFICDGYDSEDYFHFNWGWSGSCNGYYELDALSPTEPGSGGGNGDYNYEHCVIVGIQPAAPLDTVVVTWMVNDEVFATTDCCYGNYVLPGSELTGVMSSNYEEWHGLTVSSIAVYAGNTAGGHEAIQMRSANSNSGIVTTSTGGKAKKITIDWSANTINDRVVDVYGKNTAYTSASDLYDASAKGDLLGSIKKGTSTELTINGDYTFIGLRSRSSALYMNSVSILWNGQSIIYSDYTTEYDCQEQSIEPLDVKPVSLKLIRNGQLIIVREGVYYSITGNRVHL